MERGWALWRCGTTCMRQSIISIGGWEELVVPCNSWGDGWVAALTVADRIAAWDVQRNWSSPQHEARRFDRFLVGKSPNHAYAIHYSCTGHRAAYDDAVGRVRKHTVCLSMGRGESVVGSYWADPRTVVHSFWLQAALLWDELSSRHSCSRFKRPLCPRNMLA